MERPPFWRRVVRSRVIIRSSQTSGVRGVEDLNDGMAVAEGRGTMRGLDRSRAELSSSSMEASFDRGVVFIEVLRF
jgi:hypothetical protein